MNQYIMVVEFVTPSIAWECVTNDEDYFYITDHYLGDAGQGHTWDPYYPEKYERVWVVDAQEVLIVRDTLEECVKTAYDTTRDQMLAYYIDALNSEEEEALNVSFKEYYSPILERVESKISEVLNSPTLKSTVV